MGGRDTWFYIGATRQYSPFNREFYYDKVWSDPVDRNNVTRNNDHDATCSVPRPRADRGTHGHIPGIDSVGARVVNAVSEAYWNLNTWTNRYDDSKGCLFGRANPSTRPKFDINAIDCQE